MQAAIFPQYRTFTMAQKNGQIQMGDVTQLQSSANADINSSIYLCYKLFYCSIFDGDRKEFSAWLLEICNKLHTNEQAIGTSKDQWNYIYAALGLKPKNTVLAFAKLGGSNA
jgi:hypothetical protein